jgi:hypothetical protein
MIRTGKDLFAEDASQVPVATPDQGRGVWLRCYPSACLQSMGSLSWGLAMLEVVSLVEGVSEH